MSEEVKIDGLQELRAALLRLPDQLQTNVLQKALTGAANVIVADARIKAPKDTGTLQRAIFQGKSRKSTRTLAVRQIGVRSGKRERKRGRDAFYWRFIEFGHGEIKLKKDKGSLGRPGIGFFGKIVRAQPARPFLRPAFESKKLQALNVFRLNVMAELAKIAAKVRR